MGEPSIAPSIPEEKPADSFFSRALGMFISPGATSDDIARKPGFVAPIATLIVASCALFDAMYWKFGVETLTRLQFERSSFASRMTPEQMEQAINRSAGHLARTLILTDVSIVIATLVGLLIIAGLGMMIVNAILGGEAKFKTLFSVASYAHLPSVLGVILALPIALFGGTDNLDPQNPMPVNLAFFLNYRDVSKPLFALAGSVDIVVVWIVILLGLGMSRATGGKVKALPITLCFVGAWAIWIVGKVALASIF
ncbi:MAG: YIP1 family protein [Acidobacteriota bacterium]|nr:YIP1 family protein [Acidobacteriota bacterium]